MIDRPPRTAGVPACPPLDQITNPTQRRPFTNSPILLSPLRLLLIISLFKYRPGAQEMLYSSDCYIGNRTVANPEQLSIWEACPRKSGDLLIAIRGARMNNKSQFQSMFPITAIALLLAFVGIILIMTGPTAADTQGDAVIFLPFVTSPILPVDKYETSFDSSIEPWTAVRWHENSSHTLSHDAGCENSLCGFLNLEEQAYRSYVIASPLIEGPNRPYSIVFRAKWHKPKDQQEYGAIFSADAAGQPCPGDNTSTCFNRYYEVLVRYRSVEGAKSVEYRIRRIDGHDENNAPIAKNLTDWTEAVGAKLDDFNKWEIIFRESGQINVKMNNDEQAAYARDNKYDDQRFFGVITGTYLGDHALVKFDRFRIEKPD